MKKKFLVLLMLILCCCTAPILSACSGKGSTEVKSVRFVKDVYELDSNTPTKLDYKFYPSTASSNDIRFEATVPGVVQSSLVCRVDGNGVCTIFSETLNVDATVAIYRGNNKEDECIVRLKKYPNRIYFKNSQGSETITGFNLNLGGATNLNLWGEFTNVGEHEVTTYDSQINSNNYKVKITSDNQRVVYTTADSNGLIVYSTGIVGSAKVSVSIINGKDENVASADVIVNVIGSVDRAVVMMQGQSSFISPTTSYVSGADQQAVTYVVTDTTFNIKAYLFNKINDDYVKLDALKLSAVVDRQDLATITPASSAQDNNEFELTLNVADKLCWVTVRVELTCDGVDASGNPVKFIFYVAYHANNGVCPDECLNGKGICTGCPDECPCKRQIH